MACTGNIAPLNMTTTKNIQQCDVTCKFQFSYGLSTCKVTPSGNFLKYSYDGITNVTYNATSSASKYNVQEVRIYAPPLNKYSSSTSSAGAELFIHHVSPTTGKNLLICVPIAIGGGVSRSSQLFSKIITNSIEKTNGEQTINVSDFTLDALVPLTEFYQYNGPIPYSPTGNNICSNTNADIILFPANNSINMDEGTYQILNSLISKNTVKDLQTPSNVGLRYNKSGTTNNEGNVGDDIYIQCHPLDEDGNVVYDENVNGVNGSQQSLQKEKGLTKEEMDKILEYGGIAAAIGILFVGAKLINNFLKKEASS